MTLLGYTLVITNKELSEDYDDYVNENIVVYKTLKRTFEVIEEYIENNELEEIAEYVCEPDDFIEEFEGKYFDSEQVVTIGDILDSTVIIIKCVSLEE